MAGVTRRNAGQLTGDMAANERNFDTLRVRELVQDIRDFTAAARQNPDLLAVLDGFDDSRLTRLQEDLMLFGKQGTDRASAIREQMFKAGILHLAQKRAKDMDDDQLSGLVRAPGNVQTPEELGTLGRAIRQPRLLDYLYEVQYVNMLSSPVTHLVNAAANTAQLAGRLAFNPLTVAGDVILNPGNRQTSAHEVGAAFRGAGAGLAEGLRGAGQVMRTGERPGASQQAIESAADEVFYGGAAGSGKTDLALGLAFSRHRASVIFRREYAQLSEVIRRSREIAPSGWTYSESRSTWRGPDGRFLEFAGCEHEDDKRKWRVRPHDLYVFDQAPEFTETQVRFITAWLRSTDPSQRLRVVLPPDGETTAELVKKALVSGGYCNLDVIGVGGQVYGLCKAAGTAVRAVNFAEPARGRDQTGTMEFVNIRAQAYWFFRGALDPSNPNPIALPPDRQLPADLTSPRWFMRLGGAAARASRYLLPAGEHGMGGGEESPARCR